MLTFPWGRTFLATEVIHVVLMLAVLVAQAEVTGLIQFVMDMLSGVIYFTLACWCIAAIRRWMVQRTLRRRLQ
jgi:hypothetical protein